MPVYDDKLVLAPGDRFRGLLIHSVLGQGAMGTAYLASHPVLRTPLVVKIFSQREDGDVFQEAHLAARVRSPHVVGVLDAGYEGGSPFVVQQYVDGIDLAELLSKLMLAEMPMPFDLVVRAAIDIAAGLHALHQAGVVHQDVKPENLFLRGSGDALVGDLGIAVDAKARASGVVAGTPLFMAPEQWLGLPLDRRTDEYALGGTLHALLAGSMPFFAESLEGMRRAHLERAYEAPVARDPREAYFFAVVARMLSKDRDDRYPTLAAVADALRPLARPPSAPTGFARGADANGSSLTAELGPLTLKLARGDLADAESDVLVNAANWQLTMNVGVAHALSGRAGPSLQDEARAKAPARMGDIVWTGAGRLKANHVAHAVSALAGAVCIQRCVLRALLDAEARGATSLAMPSLGTGVGEVPMSLGAELALQAITTFASLGPRRLRSVSVVLHTETAFDAWADTLRGVAPTP
ncbi:MAG: serine/threonine-protein kinase [Myxococcales bacterium]|nr:serine/threonine-protein kinase [Myxococcales bacterium]